MHTFHRFCLIALLTLALPAAAAAQTGASLSPTTATDAAQAKAAPAKQASSAVATSRPVVTIDINPNSGCGTITVVEVLSTDENYCRWYDEDLAHAFLDYEPMSGFRLENASLGLKYADADFHDQPASRAPELDVVQFGLALDATRPVRSTLGVLHGWNESREGASYDVTRELETNTTYTVPFHLNIDAANTTRTWCLRVKAVQLVSRYRGCYTHDDSEETIRGHFDKQAAQAQVATSQENR